MRSKGFLLISMIVFYTFVVLPYNAYANDTNLTVHSVENALQSFDMPDRIVYDDSFYCSRGFGDIVLENISSHIDEVSSSNESVVDRCDVFHMDNSCIITLHKIGAGTTTITITDEEGNTGECVVIVKDSYIFTRYHCMVKWNYGEKIVNIDSIPNSRVTLTIHGDKYTSKSDARGRSQIRVNKIYKYKSVYKVTSAINGTQNTIYGSIRTDAQVWNSDRIKSSTDSILIYARGVHKGDKLIIKTNDQTVNYRFTSNVMDGGGNFVIPLKKPIGNAAYIKFTIKNKYGQKLYSSMEKLYL